MRAIIQRAKDASVTVDNEIVGEIGYGLVILVGVTHDDTEEDIDYLVRKITNLRIFSDEDDKMNLSLLDVNGDVLSISQFTLYADTRKGRRPSYKNAAHPDLAKKIYEQFNTSLNAAGVDVATGVFGAMMDVRFTNEGPVTITLDSND